MKRITGFTFFTPRSPLGRAVVAACLLAFAGFLLFLVFFFYAPFEYSLTAWAPKQPIPYSHKLHAGELEINCLYCHSYARRSEMAGIPSISKCIGCHSNLTIDSEPMEVLNKHSEDATPIEWIRVYDLPDHVWFSHKRHVAKEIACRDCHGAVETLEVNARLVTYKMGFCLNCHQEKEAPTDCWTCHI